DIQLSKTKLASLQYVLVYLKTRNIMTSLSTHTDKEKLTILTAQTSTSTKEKACISAQTQFITST
ncbi:20928_t:CDS:1, partial [Racocetra persica]